MSPITSMWGLSEKLAPFSPTRSRAASKEFKTMIGLPSTWRYMTSPSQNPVSFHYSWKNKNSPRVFFQTQNVSHAYCNGITLAWPIRGSPGGLGGYLFCFDLRPRRTKNAAEAPPTQRATQKTIEGKVRTKESGAASCSLIYIAGSQSLTLSYPRCVRRIKERERWHPDSYRSLKISSFWLPGGDCEDAAQAQTLMW